MNIILLCIECGWKGTEDEAVKNKYCPICGADVDAGGEE